MTKLTPKQLAIKDMQVDAELSKSRKEATERGFHCVPLDETKIIFTDEIYDHIAGYKESHLTILDEED
jgi:hypothetical protein